MNLPGSIASACSFSLSLMLGCLGASHVSAGDWTDPAGDVVEPSADVVSGSATVFEGMVDLRMRFSAPPFPETYPAHLSWCLDTDENPATGATCGYAGREGADAALGLDGPPGGLSTCNIRIAGSSANGSTRFIVDQYESFWYDPVTYTVRILFPFSRLSDGTSFHYFTAVNGLDELAPQRIGFGTPEGFFVSDEEPFPPFAGRLWCTRETVGIEVLPGNDQNVLSPAGHRPVRVALLSTDAFDPHRLFVTEARFGATGTEAEPIGWAEEDVDHDGDLDVILTFDMSQTGIRCGDESAIFKAYDEHWHGVQGTASIRTGCKSPH